MALAVENLCERQRQCPLRESVFSPSPRLLSDLAFLLFAASALAAAISAFALSRVSFSLLLRAAAPRRLAFCRV
jgi:hypothetical protein